MKNFGSHKDLSENCVPSQILIDLAKEAKMISKKPTQRCRGMKLGVSTLFQGSHSPVTILEKNSFGCEQAKVQSSEGHNRQCKSWWIKNIACWIN